MFRHRRRGGMRGSFLKTATTTKASKFLTALQLSKQSYPKEKRYQTRNYNKFRQRNNKYHNYNNQSFQLYDEQQQSWANQIDQPPILLASQDIQNWLSFRTNHLQQQRLYLWHATKFDWIPLWASQKGFQLIEQDILPYDKIL